MIKFYLEQYNSYYPLGGRDDFSGPFNSIDEAKEYAKSYTFEWQCIIKVEDNILEPVLWYRLGSGWINKDQI